MEILGLHQSDLVVKDELKRENSLCVCCGGCTQLCSVCMPGRGAKPQSWPDSTQKRIVHIKDWSQPASQATASVAFPSLVVCLGLLHTPTHFNRLPLFSLLRSQHALSLADKVLHLEMTLKKLQEDLQRVRSGGVHVCRSKLRPGETCHRGAGVPEKSRIGPCPFWKNGNLFHKSNWDEGPDQLLRVVLFNLFQANNRLKHFSQTIACPEPCFGAGVLGLLFRKRCAFCLL